jgi:hypothetical protein
MNNPLFNDAEFAAMNDRVLREVPLEKARAVVRQAEIGRILEKCGSIQVPGLGQRVGVMDARTFMRWWKEDPDIFNSKRAKAKFLGDNPQYAAKGYKPQPTAKIFDMGAKAAAPA